MSSIGQHRKRTRTGDGSGARGGKATAGSPSPRESSNGSPATALGKSNRHPDKTTGQSPEPSSDALGGNATINSDDGSSGGQAGPLSAVMHAREPADRDGADDMVENVASIFSRGSNVGRRAGGPGKEAGASSSEGVVITADSFDLQENLERRETFQAGVQATLRDTVGDSHDMVARGDGTTGGKEPGGDSSCDADGGDVASAGEGPGGARGGKAPSTSAIGKSKAASQGKGRGKASAAGGVKLTPMEQQVSDLKAQYPGVLLLVECGYRYRFFGGDALAAAKVGGDKRDAYGVRGGVCFFCREDYGHEELGEMLSSYGAGEKGVLSWRSSACAVAGDFA